VSCDIRAHGSRTRRRFHGLHDFELSRRCLANHGQRAVSAAGEYFAVNQQLLLRNEYLAAENRILRAQLPKRLRLTDTQRCTLVYIGKRLGRKALEQVACVVKPDTILGWYRRLIAQRQSGRVVAITFYCLRVTGILIDSPFRFLVLLTKRVSGRRSQPKRRFTGGRNTTRHKAAQRVWRARPSWDRPAIEAQVRGAVHDSSGGIIVGAKVTITGVDTDNSPTANVYARLASRT
jgi:hypothetical protein